MASGLTLKLESSSDVGIETPADHIQKLFPKCRRPTAPGTILKDVELPPSTSGCSQTPLYTAYVMEPRNLGNAAVECSDPKIIEVAGGRELYSQSKSSKMLRNKSASSGPLFAGRTSSKVDDTAKELKTPPKHKVWDISTNKMADISSKTSYIEGAADGGGGGSGSSSIDMASMLNEKRSDRFASSESNISDGVFSQDLWPPPVVQRPASTKSLEHNHHYTSDGCHMHPYKDITVPDKYTEHIGSDTSIITTRSLPTNVSKTQTPSPDNQQRQLTFSVSGEVIFDDIDEHLRCTNLPPPFSSCSTYTRTTINHSDDEHLTCAGETATVIGNVPIAVYEGSPRRYGRTNNNVPSLPLPVSTAVVATTIIPTTTTTQSQPIYEPFHFQPPMAISLLTSPSVPSNNHLEFQLSESYNKDHAYEKSAAIVHSSTALRPHLHQPITNGHAGVEMIDDPPNVPYMCPPTTETTTTSSSATFDYLYEFSETRKVLEEFFKGPSSGENSLVEQFNDLEYELRTHNGNNGYISDEVTSKPGSSYVGERLARSNENGYAVDNHLHHSRTFNNDNDCHMYMNSPTHENYPIEHQNGRDNEHETNFLDLSAGTDSSGDIGGTEIGLHIGHGRTFAISPDTTYCDSNCGDLESELSLMLMDHEIGRSSGLLGSINDLSAQSDQLRVYSSMPVLEDGLSSGHASDTDNTTHPTAVLMKRKITEIEREINQNFCKNNQCIGNGGMNNSTAQKNHVNSNYHGSNNYHKRRQENGLSSGNSAHLLSCSSLNSLNGLDDTCDYPELLSSSTSTDKSPPSPAPMSHRPIKESCDPHDVAAAIKDICLTLQRTKALPVNCHSNDDCSENSSGPVWIPRQIICLPDTDKRMDCGDEEENDTDLETDRLLGQQRTDDQQEFTTDSDKDKDKKKCRNKEGVIHQRSVLIEGVLFRARYLGSTQLVCEGQPTKTTRMMQAEEAVSRIKAPDGENQPSTEVDLFISTEKIMVLNTDLKEIMMDHALRTISYIADIGDLVVLMARRRFIPQDMDDVPKLNRTPKMICHVFESDEAQFIAQSIGQAFQVAYMEFLKANGIEDHSFVKEMDYQEVLNSQEIFGDELQMFSKKEMQKEVVVPKTKGEILGVVIVESGWGSMLPTVVIANLASTGAAARCGHLNIGDQIIAINGVSLVGLPLSTCQNYIKNAKNQTVVKLTVVPCAPVVEVKIKRPDTKYQLGFSVQNGVICSLLRGGIAERGGVRVGHRIIEINNQSVVAVPHEKIVNLLATSVGEILMKTMPTSMFRLLTGQENPIYI